MGQQCVLAYGNQYVLLQHNYYFYKFIKGTYFLKDKNTGKGILN